MIHSEACTRLVASFEGFRSHVYFDQGGVATIGYGHTQGVHSGSPACTIDQALIWLDIDLHTADDAITRLVKIPLKQYEWDGLCSFVYNVGQGAFSGSTMLSLLNQNIDRKVISNQFMHWVNVNGEKNEGLVNRRWIEARTFLNLSTEKPGE